MSKLIAALVFFGVAWSARAVAPTFTQTDPPGGQRGKETIVTFRGDRLEDVEQIHFYNPGIEVLGFEEKKERSVRAKIRIAEGCALGEHPVRIRTATGLTPMRLFFVGPYPAVEEVEPNNVAAAAQKIPLGITVSGQLGTEDADFFVVEAKKGERLSVEMEGARLGRTMLDSYVSITDAATGKLLAESDDAPLLVQDTFVSILAPADGKYIIQARDGSYSGGGHYYRLHVGSFPRPASVYPAGGRAGETADFKFIGDVKGDFKQQLHLPSRAGPRFGVVAELGGTAPSPNWVRVSEFPNVVEAEPNDTQKAATAAKGNLPLAFNGILAKAGDADWFKFTAKKDQVLEFNLYGRRLGSALDSVIQVFNEKGGSLGQNDDSGGPDSYLRITIPADGEYFLKVSDQLNGGGPAWTYRVEITEPKPSVTLSIPDTARYDYETRKSIVVPRGNHFALLMNAARSGFNGELELTFPNLPKGIKAAPARFAAGQNSVPVVFEAAADAEVSGNFLVPTVKPVDKSKSVESSFRHRVEWVRIQNNTVYVMTDVDKITAAVTKEVPFKIRIVEPKLALTQSGSLDLRVEAEREKGFDGPITVRMVYNPPGVGSLPDMVIGKGSNSVNYRVNATATAELRKWPIAIVAGAKLDPKANADREREVTTYVSSQLLNLEVAPAFVLGTMDLVSTERGKPARMVCKLEQKTPFTGKVKVELIGLPANTTAAEKMISTGDTEVAFDIKTGDNSPAGLHKNIVCVLTMTKGSDTLTQTVASGGKLRIDAPRARLADAGTPAKSGK
ncbi:MAG: PPC domain-containing protein [Verrucomicrobia bacterium]|nr:PPC domain-containing protein [Verrucomicrobiota bacterium]